MNSDKVRELVDAGKINCPFCGTKPKEIRSLLRRIWRDYGKCGDISAEALEQIERLLKRGQFAEGERMP